MSVIVQNKHIKRAGKYLLGFPLPKSYPESIKNWVAREDGTCNFRVVRILNLVEDQELTEEQILLGKTILETEFILLRLLEGELGIMRHYGMFPEKYDGEDGKEYPRIISVVDCYVPHDFSPQFSSYTNLNDYMLQAKRISEEEAIQLFVHCLRILSRVHEMNIVHRDLKLSNFVLNKQTGQLYLVEFVLGTLLNHENELLQAQAGYPAYISPDIISRQPYLGKPTDMWSMGVIFYKLLFAQFPFSAKELPVLFKKISSISFEFPSDINVSARSKVIVESVFKKNPIERLTCVQVLDELLKVPIIIDPSLQVVPGTAEEADSSNAPEITRKPPLTISYDSQGEIRLKMAEWEKLQRAMAAYHLRSLHVVP